MQKLKLILKMLKANQAITAATTNAEVDEAKTNAEAAINAVTPKVMKKQAAKDEIDQLQAAQTAVINNDQNATNEEKEAAIQQLATAVTDAKNNITAATDNNGVDTAKDAGKIRFKVHNQQQQLNRMQK